MQKLNYEFDKFINDDFFDNKNKILRLRINFQNALNNGHSNIDNNLKFNCIQDCNNICNKFLDGSANQIDNYKNCLKNCKNVMNSCKNYCETNDDEIGRAHV